MIGHTGTHISHLQSQKANQLSPVDPDIPAALGSTRVGPTSIQHHTFYRAAEKSPSGRFSSLSVPHGTSRKHSVWNTPQSGNGTSNKASRIVHRHPPTFHVEHSVQKPIPNFPQLIPIEQTLHLPFPALNSVIAIPQQFA